MYGEMIFGEGIYGESLLEESSGSSSLSSESSGSSEGANCWVPESPQVTEITDNTVVVASPAVVPINYTLSLQIKIDGGGWITTHSNVEALQMLTIIDLPSGTWFTLRWVPVPVEV